MIYACFVDFRKAYDSVWRNGLSYKLMKCRVSRKFLSLISNIYNNVNLCVRVKGGLTQNFQSEVGVKQGCNLSPNLFNTFLYDLENILVTIVM